MKANIPDLIIEGMVLTPDVLRKFWGRVAIRDFDECWLWVGFRNKQGYGVFVISGINKLAHRISWMLSNNKDVPNDLCVCHKCDNPPCINPRHLWLGTSEENHKDKMNKGRLDDRKGSNNRQAKLTEKDIPVIRERIARGDTYADIGRDYDVMYTTISKIDKKISWSHVP